jgi:predicted Rossmann fold flavoprotein
MGVSLVGMMLSVGLAGRIAVIGGGASGIFSAIAAAESSSGVQVVVLEAGRKTLTKVAISGGGRCNVLHDTSKPISEILNGYPRGKKELTGLLQKRFAPTQAQEWFTKRGVVLKTEQDGRMFPSTDSSQTIIDTLLGAAEQAGVKIVTQTKTVAIQTDSDMFIVTTRDKGGDSSTHTLYDSVILATGSSPSGYQLAVDLGLDIVKPVPSLFTLSAKTQVQEGGPLHCLSGLSVPSAEITFKLAVPGKKKKKTLQQEGPLLITHHGISGPATLRLSAFAAREFYDIKYQGDVTIHWAPELGSTEEIYDQLWKMTMISPKRAVSTSCPLMRKDGSSAVPKRLWQALCLESGFEKETRWAEATKKSVRALACMMSEFVLHVTGKGVFKEEFVTAGGVSLKDIDMRTMESKSCPGLFLCGELIDIDGITGGYNFMNCWSTGYVAGTSAAKYVMKKFHTQGALS